jgi:uncharacterized Zn-binding protein involved in type VI secretion
MNVDIVQVVKPGDEPLVEVQTPQGRVRALWHGTEIAAGDSRGVEIEISQTLRWGNDIAASQGDPAMGHDDSGKVFIVGQLEEVYDDGVVVVRVGDAVVQVETEGDAPARGTTVRVLVDQLELWDTNT